MLDDVVNPAMPDISNLTALQLKELIDAAQARLKDVESDELQATREKLQQFMDESGLDIAHVLSTMIDGMRRGKEPKFPAKRAAAKAKYRNPADPSQTWSGRGRIPTWMTEAMEASGTTKEDYLLNT